MTSSLVWKCLSIRLGMLVVSLACFQISLTAQPVAQPKDREIIRQARASYYNLAQLGFEGFQSSIKPNWEVALAEQLKENPTAARAALNLLSSLHFGMTLDQSGTVQVSHRSDSPAPNAEAEAAFKQIYSGLEEALSGFFATWNVFMLTSPFPAPDRNYQLQDSGSGYILTYKDGSANVRTAMTKDFIITELQVTDPTFESSIRPMLTSTPKGLICTDYDANYDPVKGPGKTKLHVTLDYQEVNGLQLPRRLRIASVYDGVPADLELLFGDYRVKVR